MPSSWATSSTRIKFGQPYSPVYLKTVHNQLSAIFNHAVRYYNLRDLFTLPSLCLSLGLEAPLLGLFPLTIPIGIAINCPPSSGFFFLVNCHFQELGISKSHAYKVIHGLNEELQEFCQVMICWAVMLHIFSLPK